MHVNTHGYVRYQNADVNYPDHQDAKIDSCMEKIVVDYLKNYEPDWVRGYELNYDIKESWSV